MNSSEIKLGERVKDVHFTEDTLSVDLIDGRTITVPLVWYPKLLEASQQQRLNWKISGAGYGIYWSELDEDLSTEGLLRGAPAAAEPARTKMPDVPMRMVFGHPEMWEKVHHKYHDFFTVLPKLQDALNGLVFAAYDPITKPQRAILNLATLSMISMLELVTLVGNGLAQGGMKILRSMLEYGINAEYLRRNPEEVDDFIEWHWVEHYKLLNYMRDHMPDAYAKLTPEHIAESEAEYIRVKPRFENETRSGKLKIRDSWCSLNLAERAIRTDFEEHYKLIYPLTSRLLHGSVAGMALHYDPDEDPHRLAVPPSLEWSNGALVGGHAIALCMAGTFSQAFGVESNPPYAELKRDYKTVWAKKEIP